MANNKDAFFAWASSVLPPARIKRLGENLTRVQKFAAASRLMAGSLFNVTNKDTLNNISQAILVVLKNKHILFPWAWKFKEDIFDDFNTYRQYCDYVLSQEVSKTNPQAPAITPIESEFRAFLASRNLVEKTLTSYTYHIKRAERYAKERGYTHCSLFGESKEETIATAKELYNHPDFLAHENRYIRIAVNKLLECIGAQDIIKPIEKPLDKRFLSFLKKEKLAKKTCDNYIAHIKKAESYAKERGYAHCSLFCESTEEIIATAQELYADADFITWNKKVHMTFSAAINRLLEFIGAKPIRIDKSTLYKASAEKVLEKHYAYGCRYDSLREMRRFRSFAQEMNVPLPEDDEALKEVILTAGILIEGNVYFKNEAMLKELERIVTSAFASGATVLYYESLWGDNLNFVNAHGISPSMLKEYLMAACQGYYFAESFMAKGQLSEAEAITQNIQRVWGETPLESAEALAERLPYIPAECMSKALSKGSFFMRDGGSYLRLDRFLVTEDEKNAAISFVIEQCMEHGFCTLQDIPLGSIEEENCHLSQNTIYNALYKSLLAENFKLKSGILTPIEKIVTLETLLKQFIRGREQCTFSELEEEVKRLTGKAEKRSIFKFLYNNMVRVNKDVFVAKSLVHFSVKDIDAILQSLITDHFIAIRSVTTFALFPPCGYAWNHYVLGSFCYKYSSKYCLHVPAFNDKNAGIIAERDFDKTYNEMLALALLRDHVELEPKAAGQYFSSMGYKARNPYDELENVVARALELRQGE